MANVWLFLSAFAAFTTMVGLFKPWVVLWWSDFANRLIVLKIYGSLSLIFLAIYYWMR